MEKKKKYLSCILGLFVGMAFCGIVGAATLGTDTNGIEISGYDDGLVYGKRVEFFRAKNPGSTTAVFNTDGSRTVGNGSFKVSPWIDRRVLGINVDTYTSASTLTAYCCYGTQATNGSKAWIETIVLSITGTETIVIDNERNAMLRTTKPASGGDTMTATANITVPYCEALCIGISGTATFNVGGEFANHKR